MWNGEGNVSVLEQNLKKLLESFRDDNLTSSFLASIIAKLVSLVEFSLIMGVLRFIESKTGSIAVGVFSTALWVLGAAYLGTLLSELWKDAEQDFGFAHVHGFWRRPVSLLFGLSSILLLAFIVGDIVAALEKGIGI